MGVKNQSGKIKQNYSNYQLVLEYLKLKFGTIKPLKEMILLGKDQFILKKLGNSQYKSSMGQKVLVMYLSKLKDLNDFMMNTYNYNSVIKE